MNRSLGAYGEYLSSYERSKSPLNIALASLQKQSACYYLTKLESIRWWQGFTDFIFAKIRWVY